MPSCLFSVVQTFVCNNVLAFDDWCSYREHASASEARAKFSFAGKHVAWVASTGSNRGKAEVWVDRVKVKTVDLYASTAEPRKMVFTKDRTTSANHTVEVRAMGTKNAASTGTRVDVDAFVALR